MSTIKTLPLTIKATRGTTTSYETQIVMAKNYDSFNKAANSYWVQIVDRTTLKVVADINFTDNTNVPVELTKYHDNQYFMILTTFGMSSTNLPQGAFAKFLYGEGAGEGLARAEQTYEALNCGEWGRYAYTFVSILADPTTNGFESLGIMKDTIMTLSLQGVSFGSNTLWTPSSLVAPQS